MRFDLTRIVVESVDLDPNEYRGLTFTEVFEAIRGSVPSGCDTTDIWNAAAEIYAAVGES